MSYSTDLTNEQWALLEPVFNAPGERGPTHAPDLLRVVDAIAYETVQLPSGRSMWGLRVVAPTLMVGRFPRASHTNRRDYAEVASFARLQSRIRHGRRTRLRRTQDARGREVNRMSKGSSSDDEWLAELLQDAEIHVVEGSRFENDENMLLDMFLSDFDEVEDLIQLRNWVIARAAGRRKRKQVSNDTKLEVCPSSATVTVSGRWDRDWGEVTMNAGEFVELCDSLIERGGID